MAHKVFQTQVNDDSLAKKETMEAGIQTDNVLAKKEKQKDRSNDEAAAKLKL